MIASLFNKAYGYVIIAGLVVGAFFSAYLKGRRDSSNATERRVLTEDIANRREAEDIRRAVDVSGDPSGRLQRWTREGR